MTRIVFAIVVWISFIPTALSWEPIAGTFPKWEDGEVTYVLNRAGSDDLGSDSEAVVRDAMGAWGQFSCTDLRITYGGLSDLEARAADGNHVLAFVETDWQEGAGVLGVTSSRFNGDRLVEADIAFNGDNWTWTTGQGDLRSWTCNAATIISHEGGHFFGIGHSDDTEALMFAAYSGGTTPIANDDQEAICSLYPNEPVTPTGCPANACPSGQECVAGTCVASSTQRLCAPCGGAGECGGAEDACLLYPDGTAACGTACGTCPPGFACTAVQGLTASQCVRVVDGVESCSGYVPSPPTGTPDAGVTPDDGGVFGGDGGVPASSGSLGTACVFNADCDSGLCIDHGSERVCSEPCTGACSAGFRCVDYDSVGLCLRDPASATESIRGGCSTGGQPKRLPAITLAVVILFLRRRRR